MNSYLKETITEKTFFNRAEIKRTWENAAPL